MSTFETKLSSTLAELTENLRYLHKPTGDLIAPQIIDVCLERRSGEVEEANEFPFVRWKVVNETFTRGGVAELFVTLDSGIYTEGTTLEGETAIRELAAALGTIVRVPFFAPYKLRDNVPCYYGDRTTGAEGDQPHPYYYARHELTFVGKGAR